MTRNIISAVAVVLLLAAPVRAADVKSTLKEVLDVTTMEIVISVMEMEVNLNAVKASMAQRAVEAKAAARTKDFASMQRIADAAMNDLQAIVVAERHAAMSLKAITFIGVAYRDWCGCKVAPEVVAALQADYIASLARSLEAAKAIDSDFEEIRALRRG